jgi:SAM-dependent methyltransferase
MQTVPHIVNPGADDAGDARAQFLALLSQSLQDDSFARLVLAKYHGPETGLLRVIARRLTVRGKPHLSFVYRYKTRDVTKNVPVGTGVEAIGEEIGRAFENAHLLTTTQDIQLAVSRKGKASLRIGRTETTTAPSDAHDREKHRFLDLDRPFLSALGVTDAQHRLVPTMARKWKQINKFIEVLDHAFSVSPLKDSTKVRVMDFGSGKGYLTFAVEDYLRNTLGREARVTGVELRADLVALCGAAAQGLSIAALSFEQGDIGSRPDEPIDIMIALHACDTATDHAIHKGIRAGASIILCAPCCHKELRSQMKSPPLLRPMLQHGIHLGQEAEMLTDGLRALLLDAEGYDTKVFEFVSLEHTSKNKMILAVRRAQPAGREAVRAQIREIKNFYGIESQCLEALLAADVR